MGTLLFAPYHPHHVPEPHLFFGLDLGRRQDPSAIAILERNTILGPFDHAWRQHARISRLIVRHAEPFPLGLPYLEIVRRVTALLHSTSHSLPGNFHLLPGHELNPKKTLAIDATGVGAPVVELFKRQSLPATLLPITITGGTHPAKDPFGGFLVPRRDLLSNLRVLLETSTLKIPGKLHRRQAIIDELNTLQDSPSPRPDDLALALALAAWSATRK